MKGISYRIWLIVGFVLIVLIGVGAAYIMLKTPSSSSSASTSSPIVSPSSGSSPVSNNFYLLVFTQKGLVQVIDPFSQSSQFLGFQRVANISLNTPAQVYYWDEVPNGHMFNQTYILVPVNNGTVYIVNAKTMKVVDTITVGHSIGFIGVALSPNGEYAAIADGPSGKVEVIDLENLQVVWSDTFLSPVNGKTFYPCDVRWTPNGQYLIVPLRFNDSVDLINASNGAVIKVLTTSLGSQPYMVSPNMQGTMLAVEFAGNDSVGFYSLPNLQYMGMVTMPSGIVPQRGVFTPSGNYYLEAPANANEIIVISTSNFNIVSTISLPSISPAGLADIELTPGGSYAYVVIHGSVTSGGMVVLINLNTLSIAYEVPLTTAPAIVIPISTSTANYLVDYVMLPPITGLHC